MPDREVTEEIVAALNAWEAEHKDDDLDLQDAAADLRDQGLSWDQVAHELAIPISAARRAAAGAHQRLSLIHI